MNLFIQVDVEQEFIQKQKDNVEAAAYGLGKWHINLVSVKSDTLDRFLVLTMKSWLCMIMVCCYCSLGIRVALSF